MEDITINIEELINKVSRKLINAGLSDEHSQIIADILAHGDARGVRSHGTTRLEHYITRINKGGINLHSQYEFKLTGKSCACIDVAGGMGHIGMYKATKESLKRVKETGMFAISVQNASHCGALSYYIDMALQERMIAMIFVNTDKCVVPFGGEKPYFGTNPIAFGFPGNNHNILIDMATSEVAFGKIFAARESGSDIPPTWGVDDKGMATTDPFKVVAASPMAAYKGTAIATIVEGFTGFFTGAFGPYVHAMYSDLDKYRNVGGFLFFMDPACFGDAETYYKSTDKLYTDIKNSTPVSGMKEILIPGEPEERKYQDSLKNGVIIYDNVYKFIK